MKIISLLTVSALTLALFIGTASASKQGISKAEKQEAKAPSQIQSNQRNIQDMTTCINWLIDKINTAKSDTIDKCGKLPHTISTNPPANPGAPDIAQCSTAETTALIKLNKATSFEMWPNNPGKSPVTDGYKPSICK